MCIKIIFKNFLSKHNFASFKPNHKYLVKNILYKNSAFKRRMCDMGITKNTQIYITKLAPFKGPVSFVVRGYKLSLRRSDLKNILLEEIL